MRINELIHLKYSHSLLVHCDLLLFQLAVQPFPMRLKQGSVLTRFREKESQVQDAEWLDYGHCVSNKSWPVQTTCGSWPGGQTPPGGEHSLQGTSGNGLGLGSEVATISLYDLDSVTYLLWALVSGPANGLVWRSGSNDTYPPSLVSIYDSVQLTLPHRKLTDLGFSLIFFPSHSHGWLSLTHPHRLSLMTHQWTTGVKRKRRKST